MSAIGIDLGTTNTVAARGNVAIPIPSERGRSILPSVVSFLPNGTTQVGLDAKRRRWIDIQNTIFSAKRIIGCRWSDARTQEFRKRYPFDLVEGPNDTPAFQTRAGDVTPANIASILLASVHKQIQRLKVDFDATVITVPAAFNERQRDATLTAAERADLPAVRLIDEPLSTAYAYRKVSNPVARAGVYDLGGGTFDFSIVDWSGDRPRLLGFQSDLMLGGDDIDQRLATWVAERVLKEYNWDLRNYREVSARLVAECERAKIRLCFFDETALDLSQIDPECPAATESFPISRDVLDGISQDLVRQTFVTCDGVLAKTRMRPKDLDAIFLAGGSTHLAKVREGVETYFGQRGRFELEPTEVVALGASQVAS
jgi:molecular chaperone DnaK